jgi:hypothetical protein
MLTLYNLYVLDNVHFEAGKIDSGENKKKEWMLWVDLIPLLNTDTDSEGSLSVPSDGVVT